ncbi:hypothetical protein M758_7G098500 [Ceratodon purpureus]|nr:hypothetical protein M758_7G098500 [Ceratodon purpureus]
MSKVSSGKPESIGQYLTINLTQDILGVSSTGYVIRTSCSDGQAAASRPCALKRTSTMDEEPPDLAKLSHDNVVQLMHYWIEERDLFLVMELMDGDLALLMEGTKRPGVSPFSLSVAVDIMVQIAEGMLHLHEMSVSHPHLKCDNVLYKLTTEKKTEAFRVGDVVVKLGGFGCPKPADLKSKNRDVVCFGLTCLEVLTGDEWCDEISSGAHVVPDMDIARSRIPETTPAMLRDCILRCLEMQPTFSEVVTSLLLAKSFIMQTCKDEMMYSSEIAQAESTQTITEELSSTFISNGGLKETFTVHELHSQLGDVSTSVPATLIFFHGFHKAPEEWRRTWMTRNNKLVWSQKWLPEDLGAENLRVLSVSFDANSNLSSKYNRYEMGKNLVQALVLSPKWKLGGTEGAIFLIGHSFGGVLIKSLVTEARHFVQNNLGQQEAVKCEKFLGRLAKIVFYSVPQASTGLEFEKYISQCRKVVALQGSSFLQSLEGDTHFVADMNKLSAEFESAVPEKVKFLAFLEGKPISKECDLMVTEISCEGSSHSWEWHKIDKDNHFEVCRPNSKNHTGYRILLEHLHQHLNNPHDLTRMAVNVLDSDVTCGLGKRQGDDLSKDSEAFPAKQHFGKSLSFREEGSSGSAIFSVTPVVSECASPESNAVVTGASSVPTTEYSTLPDVDSDKPSDQISREQDLPAENLEQENDDTDCKEGGVRWRETLGKFVTEYRPPRFKWKLWMGIYNSIDEARRAYDCARFYAGQDKGTGFYFEDSPALLAELGPLNRPLASVSKDIKDKAFNVELKKRAKQVISKVKDAQTSTKDVQSTSDQQLKPLHSDPNESLDPFEIDSQVQQWEGSSSQWSFYASQLDQEH